ncbi:MAG: nucleotidyltransferase family protein [Candidatus Marinimicrobia bacterium]|nr:nucleotidyltransferase family protein [Candidatus Neomarinimicrobiota bacterium]
MKKRIENITSILKSELPILKSQYNVATLGVFGSFVRDEQTAKSDVDILVSFTKSPSLFKFLELEYHLSELLDVKVDLVMKNSLKQNIGQRILSEAQAII